jgi:hypothetical protein
MYEEKIREAEKCIEANSHSWMAVDCIKQK